MAAADTHIGVARKGETINLVRWNQRTWASRGVDFRKEDFGQNHHSKNR